MPNKKYDWPGVEYGSPEYYRRYRLANLEHAREYAKAYHKKRMETHAEEEKARRKRWKENNPEKAKAHATVRRRKTIKGAYSKAPLAPKPCLLCNSTPTEAHHTDYSQPLKVIWLCKPHHVLADRVRRIGE